MGVAIRRAGEGDREALTRLLDEGFYHDPVSTWIFPDPERRRRHHGTMMGAFLDAALADGYVDMTEDGSGVALWFSMPGPDAAGAADAAVDGGAQGGHGEDAGRAAARALREAVDPDNERVEQISLILDANHPADRPHEYLMLIAVSPDQRGRGVGAALINSTLERCDREGRYAYLEASSVRSSRLYERLGFHLDSRTVDLPDGPRMLPMWREPRPRTAG
ncbi:GNAT family N-acetyltransferase [Actinacidiphila sp. DG2A-62]|uniref:GNAT family N-acetyltransferase n=1 Tax=Actinacidiphila sp. DG2A-62 TaxID=3108821 RepID=UPI002DB72EE1|nr:GNAT family N-acetyltransferase [Actinacidiphila sp. DG2A-62]MEC3995298.1 GNAT family N-acetyltransferase [Actinacidiphila sp. DG2A-62]